MSEAQDRIPLSYARGLAEKIKQELASHCERIEIAGSIRRQKPMVKDIEIVAIPKPFDTGIFSTGIATVVNQWRCIKGELTPNSKYTQRMLPEAVRLDLFLCTPQNWGWIFALRTGSDDFNQFILLRKIREAGYTAEDGYICMNGSPIWVKEETDFFERIKMDFVPPEQRNYTHPYR
ncbi:hypothetical protein [Roseivirga sp. UBA838]|uniref:hypothetical protein n=1 Tax=Roseivirga sp. UBA838 TaxID=1947393 RepID=UPI00257B2499|nr:hypothetical protein [Roseivirga sp. UBA838]|tara:strand:+ start:1371 stop:1901 length:531 start_codon:yes stop_codon:yes gene_type:complete